MTYTVRRTITLTYDNEAMYRLDRQHWLMPAEGEGAFGPGKWWQHEVEEGIDGEDSV